MKQIFDQTGRKQHEYSMGIASCTYVSSFQEKDEQKLSYGCTCSIWISSAFLIYSLNNIGWGNLR